MLRNKTFLKILSLIIAILLWTYVMGEVNPETKAKISNIEISFINTDALADRDLAIVQNKVTTVNASIKGKRSDVNDTKNSGLTATVDVSNSEKGKNTGEIVINLPDGVSLENVSAENIEFQVEDRVTEEKPVEIELLGSGEQTDKVPWVIAAKPDTVLVSGAESSVNKIDAVKGTVSKTVVAETPKSVDVTLLPVTDKGKTVFGIDLEVDNAQAQVQMMSVKTVNLNISVENLGDGLTLEKTTGDDSIKIVGSSKVLDSIEELTAIADLGGITSTGKVELKVDLPENVYLYDKDNPLIVTVMLKAAE